MKYPNIWSGITYIEDHLFEEILLEDLAKTCNYSLFHFIRKFNSLVKMSPKEFILRRRLTESLNDLLLEENRIIDVAVKIGFQSHEAYTRAFKRVFHMTPNDYKNNPESHLQSLQPLSESYYDYLCEASFQVKNVDYHKDLIGQCVFHEIKHLEDLLKRTNICVYHKEDNLLFIEKEDLKWPLSMHLNLPCIQIQIEDLKNLEYHLRMIYEMVSPKLSYNMKYHQWIIEKEENNIYLYMPREKQNQSN